MESLICAINLSGFIFQIDFKWDMVEKQLMVYITASSQVDCQMLAQHPPKKASQ